MMCDQIQIQLNSDNESNVFFVYGLIYKNVFYKQGINSDTFSAMSTNLHENFQVILLLNCSESFLLFSLLIGTSFS